MASSQQFVEYVCEQIKPCGLVSYKKMFGEYMVYVNTKPLLLVCNDTPYIRINDVTTPFLKDCETGFPYDKAKLQYILDIDNQELAIEVVRALEASLPFPRPKK